MEITYADKLSLVHSTLPDENKITDSDMNEIKNVVNYNSQSMLPIGAGCDYYANTLPSDKYKWADGSAISRTEYAELFALIGTTYGTGDGSTTFNLPDKRSRVSVGHDAFNVITSSFTNLGATGGSVSQTLTKDNLPNISGSFTMHGGSVATNINSVSGDFKTTLNNTSYRDGGTQNTGANSVGNVSLNIGSGTAHNNLQPYIVCNYIIRVK